MIAVTFHTGGKYAAMADRLVQSAYRVGLDVISFARPDVGGWAANTWHKPSVIREAMAETSDDVLFVDADSVFTQFPVDAAQDNRGAEFGCYYDSPSQAWSGTILVRRRPGWERYLDAWEAQRAAAPDRQDDFELAAALAKVRTPRIWRMPPSYCWVHRAMRARFPGTQPVVEQMMMHTEIPVSG